MGLVTKLLFVLQYLYLPAGSQPVPAILVLHFAVPMQGLKAALSIVPVVPPFTKSPH